VDELDLVRWIVERTPWGEAVKVGPGDDAAVIASRPDRDIVFTIDEVVEGVHFRLDGEGPGPAATLPQVGFKAYASAASDLAAMGAEPLAAVVAASLPARLGAQAGRAIHEGVMEAARMTGLPLVGGNITGTPGPLAVTVACLGTAAEGRAFLRSGARPGDMLYVTGELGGSILGRHLRPLPRFDEARRLRSLGGVTAMMDISDGLALDLSRMCEASGAGALIVAEAVPVSNAARELARVTGRSALDHALGDGEDYELLFAIGAEHVDKIESEWNLPTRLSRIGRVVERAAGLVIEEGGRAAPLEATGFAHLQQTWAAGQRAVQSVDGP
jgi:thiamine-monophosphate kinase